jgi:lipoyl(octanoyl) transferase
MRSGAALRLQRVPPTIVHLGRIGYREAYKAQCDHVEEVLAAREAGTPEIGRILVVEHEPVITVSRRPGAAKHLLANPELLARDGVSLEETDRGGDITYHGPGQVVLYPILDLNLLNLGLHAYMRLLEQAVIDCCASFRVPAHRDPSATGVWVSPEGIGIDPGPGPRDAKICAMGVRVRKWVSMHGLALNVRTNLEHFGLIVPCGLAGRSVTSLERECIARAVAVPTFAQAAERLASILSQALGAAAEAARNTRAVSGAAAPAGDSEARDSAAPAPGPGPAAAPGPARSGPH